MTDTYITVSEADTYFSERGNDAWPQLSQSEKQAALVVATQYISTMYVFEQTIDMSNVPAGLKHATAELALMSTQKPLTQADEPPIKEAEVAGAVSVEFAVEQVSSNGNDLQWAYINALLRGIAHFLGGLGQLKVVRA